MTRSKLKEEILRLLREDEEFRYAVAGLIGLKEILEEVRENRKAILALQEQVAEHSKLIVSLQRQVLSLQEQVAEHTRAIRALQEQVRGLQEQVRNLQLQVSEHSEAIRALQEQVYENTKAIKSLARTIEALGARWGMLAEEAFREGMRGVVEELLGVAKVERWSYYDEEGLVHGYPSMVEVDLVVRDREHILVEVKASTSRGDVVELARIGRLYEKVTGVKPRLVIVTPYADGRALEAAYRLGVEVYKAA